jgi:hypothetical protein
LAVANGGTGITSFGSGVATFLGTPSSANLAAAVTDETGSGALVFATSPSLVTPVLGTPTSGNFSSGTFTWPTFNQNTSGTASNVTGVVATANGGTNLTSFTANGLVYASSTSALATGSALTFDGSSLASNVSTNGTAGISVTNTNTGVGSSSAVFLYNDSTAETQIFTFGANRVGTFFGQSVANYSAFLTAGSASNGILLGALTNKPVIFGVNDTEQMRLTSTGLGVGTSSPATKLDVNGTVTATAYSGISGGTF